MDNNYVIAHKDGGFLYRTNNNAWDRTPSFHKATRLTREKADNIRLNSIRSTIRDMWQVISIDDVEQPYCYDLAPFHGKDFDWGNISKQQCELYKNITQYRANLDIQLSNVDKEITDIQHYIEFYSLDAAKGYKAYRMLKERLTKRRFIKDEIRRADYFIAGTATDFSHGAVTKRINNMEHRQYEPRVLCELFELERAPKRTCVRHA